MSEIERPDWEVPEAPEPAQAKEQSIPRPDWTDGPPDEPEPVQAKSQSIDRPDWDAAAPAPQFTDQETDDAFYESQNSDTPPLAETMLAELAEEHDLEIAHEAVEAMAIPDRAGFVAGFDNLPAGAQKAIVGELAQPGEWEGIAGEDELENFASTPEGEELIEEWGDDADSNLAQIQARLSRIEENTSPAAIETLWAWYDSLPSAQAKAVLQALSE